jgi:para-nitrobenzyl esterase
MSMSKRFVAAVITAMLSVGVAFADQAALKSTRVESGLLAGAAGRDPSIAVYKGVPFAAPPVGDLRWRAPAPAAAWQGVRSADKFSSICPTPRKSSESMDEDCLYLNVWTGARSADERRPVLVWIYGGGFILGSGSDPMTDGEAFARKGVIVVTFNYRLGSLGFLATPELSRESGHSASGNYGLLDQVAALRWVQKNIAAFGGDPSRVTIAGHSAGAGSVGFMSMSPLARGLFHRSIAQSQVRYPRDTELRYLSVSYRSLKDAERDGEKFVDARGTRSLKELRALPWQQLMAGSDAVDEDVYTGSRARPPLFRPSVDGWVVPQNYEQTLAKGLQNPVMFLAGNNRDESGAVPETAFEMLRAGPVENRPGMPPYSVKLDDFKAAAKQKFGPMTAEFLKLYPASNDQEAAFANNAAARDNSRISTYLWATDWQKTVKQPVYTYFWMHAPPGPDRARRGAYHGSEINYVFNSLEMTDRPWTDEDRKIADVMSSYWANYAATGNPNGPGLPQWPAFDPKSFTVMRLGDEFGAVTITDPAKLDFWKRFFKTQDAW